MANSSVIAPHATHKVHPVLGLIGWLLVTFAAPAISSTIAMPDAWYASLEKPSWNPPSWIFGPVWTLLYTLMAIAAWLVWRSGGWRQQRIPLGLYLVQLALNAAWTPLFFGLHQTAWAFVEIIVLLVVVWITTTAFLRAKPGAGWLLAPYLVWTAFATLLNGTLWWFNRR